MLDLICLIAVVVLSDLLAATRFFVRHVQDIHSTYPQVLITYLHFKLVLKLRLSKAQ